MKLSPEAPDILLGFQAAGWMALALPYNAKFRGIHPVEEKQERVMGMWVGVNV